MALNLHPVENADTTKAEPKIISDIRTIIAENVPDGLHGSAILDMLPGLLSNWTDTAHDDPTPNIKQIAAEDLLIIANAIKRIRVLILYSANPS